MKTVNELIFNRKDSFDAPLYRNAEVQEEMIKTYRDNIRQDPVIIREHKKITGYNHRAAIRQIGQGAATEIIGNLGIFLTQFSDLAIQRMQAERRIREPFVPRCRGQND